MERNPAGARSVAAAAPGDTRLELRADAARNRTRVVATARDFLETSDDLAVPMNAIAKLAGVGIGTVYRHFPTQQALLEAVAEDSFAALVVAAKAAAADSDPATAFERLLSRSLELMLADVGLAAVLSSAQFECVQTIALALDLQEAVTKVLDRAHDAGAIKPEITSDDIRRLLCGVHHAVKSGADQSSAAQTYLDILLAGLRVSSRPHRKTRLVRAR
jgi:AcrR family transcriptional regulator